MLSSGANVIIWENMLSSGMKCHHLELMLSPGQNVIIWNEMLLSGMQYYHLGQNVIIWNEMLSPGMITLAPDDNISSKMITFAPR